MALLKNCYGRCLLIQKVTSNWLLTATTIPLYRKASLALRTIVQLYTFISVSTMFVAFGSDDASRQFEGSNCSIQVPCYSSGYLKPKHVIPFQTKNRPGPPQNPDLCLVSFHYSLAATVGADGLLHYASLPSAPQHELSSDYRARFMPNVGTVLYRADLCGKNFA